MEEMRARISEFWELGNEYIREKVGMEDMIVLKFCLIAFGIIVGICLPRKWKRPVLFTSMFVFFVTYLPLVAKWGAYLGKACCELRMAANEN